MVSLAITIFVYGVLIVLLLYVGLLILIEIIRNVFTPCPPPREPISFEEYHKLKEKTTGLTGQEIMDKRYYELYHDISPYDEFNKCFLEDWLDDLNELSWNTKNPVSKTIYNVAWFVVLFTFIFYKIVKSGWHYILMYWIVKKYR